MKKHGAGGIAVFWILICSMTRLNIFTVYTNGGRLIVAVLILTYFVIDGAYIAGTSIANQFISKSSIFFHKILFDKKGLYNSWTLLEGQTITVPSNYMTLMEHISDKYTWK